MYSDELVAQIKSYVSSGQLPPDKSRQALYRFQKAYANYKVADSGQLIFNDLPVISASEIGGILAALYADPSTRLNGRDRFYARVKSMYYGITKQEVMNFLSKQETHQLHQGVYKEKMVRPIITKKPLRHLQFDLIIMENEARANGGYKIIFTCIETFSKYAWAYPQKGKFAAQTVQSLSNVIENIKSMGYTAPGVIQSDNALEFTAKETEEFFDLHGIKHITSRTYTPQSQGCVERFNRTLKQMIYQHFTESGCKKYIDILPRLLINYNSAMNTSIGMSPEAALGNRKSVHKKLTANARAVMANGGRQHTKLVVGDTVRIALSSIDSNVRKDIFRKSYKQNWSVELFTVAKITKAGRNVGQLFYVKNASGDDYNQQFKRGELLLVPRVS